MPQSSCNMSTYYFAFGSNMNKERMIEREANFVNIQKGILNDWELVFNKINSRKDGSGFANIIPKIGSIVEGMIYKVDEETLEKLDRFEGVPNHYNRKTMKIRNENNEMIDCITYLANPSQMDNSRKPEKWYLNHLLKGKEYLSEEYFSDLRKTNSLDDS
jgi:gamma-glutamylcyclotransferase